jgi:hypothetical protein
MWVCLGKGIRLHDPDFPLLSSSAFLPHFHFDFCATPCTWACHGFYFDLSSMAVVVAVAQNRRVAAGRYSGIEYMYKYSDRRL